jgi:hypothetical protein
MGEKYVVLSLTVRQKATTIGSATTNRVARRDPNVSHPYIA